MILMIDGNNVLELKEVFIILNNPMACSKIKYILFHYYVNILFQVYLKAAIEILINRNKIDFVELHGGKFALKDYFRLKKLK